MKALLTAVRNVIHALCRYALRSMIVLSVSLLIFGSLFTDQSHIKTILLTSGLYQKVVPSVLEANKKSNKGSSIALDDPEVIRIANQSFPPDDLQGHSESFIDAVYAWLKGDSPKLRFTIDITSNKQAFAQALSEYVITELAFKPDCEVQPEVYDPFQTDCRPYGVNIIQGQEQLYQDIYNSPGFLEKTVYTEDDLQKKDGKNMFDQHPEIPKLFRIAVRLPLVSVGATALIMLGFATLGQRRRKDIASLGSHTISTGVTLVIVPLLFSYIIPALFKSNTLQISAGNQIENVLDSAINTLVYRVDTSLIFYGALVVVGGALIFVGERMTRPISRYAGVEKKSGLTSSIARPKQTSPRGKLNDSTVPLQTSEGPKRNNAVKTKPKKRTYRTMPITRSEK